MPSAFTGSTAPSAGSTDSTGGSSGAAEAVAGRERRHQHEDQDEPFHGPES
jgi:hypothetical protein